MQLIKTQDGSNMDICIFYFSGTGNTWWASNKLAEELTNKGRTVEVHSIELLDIEKTSELIEDAEIIVLGYPIYGSCIPQPMKSFIDKMPNPTKTKKVGIFCTQMEFSGDGAWYYHKNLDNKGYDIKWTYHFKLPSNICLKVWPLPYSTDKTKLNKIFNKCETKIENAADDIATSAPSYKGAGVGSLLLGLMQRPIFKALIKRPFKSPYKVDSEKCVKCMRCIQICPEGNIRLVDGKITFGTNCALCMRCYNYCPKTAITAYGFSHKENKLTYKGPEGFDPALITARKDLMDFIE